MKILFLHQNCPGQFKHLAPYLASRQGNEVRFITQLGKPDVTGVEKVEYKPTRKPSRSTHHYLKLTEQGILNGQAVARAALQLKERGFSPDVVVAHVGWGEALYIKEVWPQARLLGYFEWYYHTRGADVGFLEQQPPALETAARIGTRNMMHLFSLENVDWGISPTQWQWRQFPATYRPKISVIHDGIDIARVKPDPGATGSPREGLRLRAGDEVITYVARNLEPYRGFPTFMRAAELIQKRRPECHLLVVGGDGVSYGSAPEDGRSHREHLLEEEDLDLSRIHFLGRVPYDQYVRVLQLSAAHVYLTIPFVLSWSMLEAMAAECLIIGSRTPPVQEVIKDGSNGLLVDFFSPDEVADRVDQVLDHPDRMRELRKNARRTVLQNYALEPCLKRQVRLIEQLARGESPVSRGGGSGRAGPPRKTHRASASRKQRAGKRRR